MQHTVKFHQNCKVEMGEKKSVLVIIKEWQTGIQIPAIQIALEGKEPRPDVSHLEGRETGKE